MYNLCILQIVFTEAERRNAMQLLNWFCNTISLAIPVEGYLLMSFITRINDKHCYYIWKANIT